MGMFDYVKCEQALPDGVDGSRLLFQTKDFDCEMEVITITADGRLIHDEWHYEEVPKSKRPYPDGEGLFEFFGSLKKITDKSNVDMEFHGLMRFYEYVDQVWHQYEAKFTDGTLQSIVVIPRRTIER